MPDQPATRGEVWEVAAEAARLSAAQTHLERTEKLNRVLVFVALFMTLVFAVLFIRTEVNSRAIETGFRSQCERQAATALRANAGREVLIQLVMAAQSTPENQSDAVLKKLRDGLLLPVEVCS